MARWKKTLARLMSDQKAKNFRYEELAAILTALGFELADSSGSHRKWRLRISDPSTPAGYRTVLIGLVDEPGHVKSIYAKVMRDTLIENNLVPSDI